MKVTKKWIEKWGPCSEAVDWFNSQPLRDSTQIIKYFIKHKNENNDYLEWASWAIVRFMKTKKDRVMYAVYAAKQVLYLFENKFPDDKRPREAIDAALKCIENDTAKNRFAAEFAEFAAEFAAGSAAWEKMLIKILRYGLKLIESKVEEE